MILVTSAAGHTGGIMVESLVAGGFDVAVTDIDPQVKEIPGVKQAYVGDLTDLHFIQSMLKEVDQVVYIPPLFSPQEALIGQQLVDTAAAENIEQFVFISVTHPILTTLLQHVAKRDVEEHLIYKGMETDLTYTILQPMHYMYNFDPEMVKLTGEYRIFYQPDSRVSYVNPADVAQVLKSILIKPSKHNKATYELVGTEPLSPNELVQIFNEKFDTNATAVYVPVDEFLDQIGATDLYFRKGFEQLAYSYSTWGLDGNSNVLSWLLGREPVSFTEYLDRFELK